MFYTKIRSIAQHLLRMLFRVKVIGKEHVPSQGPAVICANHISNLDPPVVGGFIDTREIHFMAKEELFRIPFIGKIITKLNAFPVKRGGGDSGAVKHAIRLLRNGHVLGIFPEGTRSKSGELGKAHVGAALIAIKGKAPMIPVAIIGPYRLFRQTKVIIGEPIDTVTFSEGKAGTDAANELTELVMLRIKQMIDHHR
jgi:1-acyl-sn-glycerol-3-phosphate acyltransferase